MSKTVGALGSSDKMVETYAKLVLSGKLDIEKVPSKYRDKVREYINQIPTN